MIKQIKFYDKCLDVIKGGILVDGKIIAAVVALL